MSIISNLNLTYTHRLRLVEFFKTKNQMILRKYFPKTIFFLPPVETDRDLDKQIDVMNNLNLEKMAKSKTNLSNIKQKELLK